MSVTSSSRDEQIQQMLTDLRFLITALDSRVPRLEHIGEARIAHEAAELRARALALIYKIEGVAPLE